MLGLSNITGEETYVSNVYTNGVAKKNRRENLIFCLIISSVIKNTDLI
jgi:hypothetical protein